ncbi:hypothetical protein ACFLQ5_02460, partial [Bacteroidota bacterium]
NGFKFKDDKLITKYPYGVALLQLPFFIAAHYLSQPLGYDNNGFSIIYHKAIDIASVFYFLLSLLLMSSFLRNYFKQSFVILILFLMFSGTNLYYYSIVETGMSHIYSFFAFALFLYSIKILFSHNQLRLYDPLI